MQTHDHVVTLGRELSKQLVREYNKTKYIVHGLFGIFAAGDVRANAMNRVASAVGEGAMAIKLVHEYLATV